MPAGWDGDPKNWNVGELLIASDFNAQLRDRMMWLKARPYTSVAVATTNTTSTSFAAISGASAAVTTVGGKVAVLFTGAMANSGAGNTWNIDVALGSTRYGDATAGLQYMTAPVANYYLPISFFFITPTAPAAGSNTFNMYWKTSAGTLTWGATIGKLEVWEIF